MSFYESTSGNTGALVIDKIVIHLNKDPYKIVEGIFQNDNLRKNMKSNVDF